MCLVYHTQAHPHVGVLFVPRVIVRSRRPESVCPFERRRIRTLGSPLLYALFSLSLSFSPTSSTPPVPSSSSFRVPSQIPFRLEFFSARSYLVPRSRGFFPLKLSSLFVSLSLSVPVNNTHDWPRRGEISVCFRCDCIRRSLHYDFSRHHLS